MVLCLSDTTESDEEFENPPGHESRSSIGDAISRRLKERQTWLRQLYSVPTSHDDGLEDRPDTVITIKPEALVFDDMTPYLRQHMPPFTISIPSHEEACEAQRRNIQAIEDLQFLGSDLLSWQIASRGRTWSKRDASIVRSLYKVSALYRMTLMPVVL